MFWSVSWLAADGKILANPCFYLINQLLLSRRFYDLTNLLPREVVRLRTRRGTCRADDVERMKSLPEPGKFR